MTRFVDPLESVDPEDFADQVVLKAGQLVDFLSAQPEGSHFLTARPRSEAESLALALSGDVWHLRRALEAALSTAHRLEVSASPSRAAMSAP